MCHAHIVTTLMHQPIILNLPCHVRIKTKPKREYLCPNKDILVSLNIYQRIHWGVLPVTA